ncbi:hypothetical protein D7V86_12250 [bacterium D16-51]|nr:hypothetical protein D7V96_14955 [bacterium D16-59]RKI59460.1 hypothetical protein D7V86_12250 [bacterium D16-51]
MAVTTAQIKKVASVASGIIYSQEGNYGSVNRNDNSHGMSVGKCQWNAYWGRALPLLQSIVKKDTEQAKKILGESLYNEIAGSSTDAWNKQERAATEEEAKAISELLKTPQGKEAQDDLAEKDITAYVKNGVKSGLVSQKALAYYADLENQGGSSASKRIATTAGNDAGGVEKVGLDKIHAYALKDSVMGQYESRRAKVYKAVKESKLTDVQEEKKQDTTQTTQNAPKSLEIGISVTFIGGGVFVSSMAKSASKTKDTVSRCRVTAANPGSKHPYHLISQDGKGVYGWVDMESIKELATTADNDPKTVSCGDRLTFTGGPVYKSSTAKQASTTKDVVSTCKVTAINAKGAHPYHCISQDGKGVYGWVDKENVK